ncbi:MAG: NAD(P)-dependent oxidoreductase [Candidatus Micrarchaeota archaeon]|nr:NAD(P)-dependent oxidoreductase [Candidatus Micrarchaeota archaeon]
MKIAFVGIEDVAGMRKTFPSAQFVKDISKLNNRNKIELLSVFIDCPIGKKELQQFPSLKYVVTRSAGYDHIDLKECKKRNISVYNVPDYGTETVAEYTILLMLAALRKFKACEDSLRSKAEIKPTELQGKEAFGKILGVVGTGRIGANVIKIANAFGMKIIAYDKFGNPELKKLGVKFVDFQELIKTSDVITLHLPLTKETYHMISEKELAKMKNGVIIINTARGGLIDIVALANAVNSGKVGGAALDVIEAEEIMTKENDVLTKNIDSSKIKQAFVGNILLQNENVIIMPHMAYNTEEALEKILEKTIITIKKLEKGKCELYNKVA